MPAKAAAKTKAVKRKAAADLTKETTAASAAAAKRPKAAAGAKPTKNGSSLNTGLKYPGAHVSSAGGVHNAVANALAIKATSFALFVKQQRQWKAKPLEQAVADQFREALKESGISPHLVLPHGSYLLNLGSPSQEVRAKSRDCFHEELKRCQQLGLKLYNFHPGSTCGKITREECISLIADEINLALKATQGVKVVLENMSKQGNTIGGDFEELQKIIALVEDKDRVGVCIDTCHAMAAGYDLSTEEGYESMKREFQETVGFKYLVGLHLNDSKGAAGCHLDRHEGIGKGKIGLEGFRRVMNDPLFADLPMILETPDYESYDKEIKLLKGLVKK